MIKITSIGNQNALFNESSGNIKVEFQNEEQATNNLSYFENRGFNKIFKFNFKNSNIESNFRIITEEKQEEEALNLLEIKPFFDSTKRKLVKAKKENSSISLPETHLEKNGKFVDGNLLTTRKYAGFESLDDVVDYPHSFNYDNFFLNKNRIDVFSNVSKIQLTQDYIDSFKGIKSNGLGNSKDAFGENVSIKNYFTKDENVVYHYEDNIISSFLINNNEKNVVEKIIKNVNPIQNTSTSSRVLSKKNIISSEVRYFAYKERNIKPFLDNSMNKNDNSIANKQNRNVFSDVSINNSILGMKNNYNYFDEKKIYSSCGIDCDYTYSNGKDSFIYNGRID